MQLIDIKVLEDAIDKFAEKESRNFKGNNDANKLDADVLEGKEVNEVQKDATKILLHES